MKKILLVICVTLSQLSEAQCVQNVNGFGNNINIPSYNIRGAVNLTLNPNKTVTLKLGSDFTTASGPDVRAYLVSSNGLSTLELRNIRSIRSLQNIEFGVVSNGSTSPNGAKTFTVSIPALAQIENYDKIFFYCLAFNMVWDFGSFNKFSGANCATLGIEENAISQIELFPNPATSEFNISDLNGKKITATIFDISGKRVASFQEIKDASSFDISNLTAGLYLVELKEENGNTSVKKLTIK